MYGVSGQVVHGTKSGPKPYLRYSEERKLVDHLKKLSDLGIGKSRREVLCIAKNVAVDKGKLRRGQISGGWWRRFLERNPGMSLRAGDATAGVRMDAINEEVFNNVDFKKIIQRESVIWTRLVCP